MKSKVLKASIIAVTSISLLTLNGVISPAITQVSAAASTISNQVIKLNSTSTITLQDAQFLMQDTGRVIAYTFVITNNGNKEQLLADYWVRLRTTTGKTFVTKISDQDKSVKGVPAKSSKTVTYYSIVDNDTKLNEFLFDIIQWDFSVSNYERRLGTIQFPSGSSVSTPFNKEKLSIFGSTSLNTKLNHATLTQDKNNAYLQLNISLKNTGLNSADISKLNLFIQTDTMAVYPLEVESLGTVALRSGEERLISIQVSLPKNLIGKPLNLISAYKDETNGVLLPVATLQIPTMQDQTLTSIEKSRQIYLSGQPINTFLDSAIIGKGQDKTTLNIQFALRNVGKESVDFPHMDFYLQTKTGTVYPLSFKSSDETVTKLLPQLREVINIEGTLPLNIDLNGASILVRNGVNEKSQGYVIGAYSFKTSQQAGGIGSSYDYGNYKVRLETIQRIASNDNDMLMADLTITNKSTSSVPAPALGGYFMINGVKLSVDAKNIMLNNNVAIAPGQSINVLVYSRVPYSTSISNISFVLTDQTSVDNSNHKQLYQFISNGTNEIKTIKSNEVFSIKKATQRFDAYLKSTAMYKNEEDQYFYMEVDLTNKEGRSSQIVELDGYLTNEYNDVIPVSFAQLNNRVRSNGKVLLTGWAKVPADFDSSKIELILGQKVPVDDQASESNNNSVLIKPVRYSLELTDAEVKNNLSNINIAGHELSFKDIHSSLYVTGMFTVSGVKLQMNYSLAKEKFYDYISGEHKVLIEFVDQNSGKATYSKQFAIGEQSQDNNLKVTENAPLEIIFEDTEIQNKIQQYDDYIINIYDVFQDAKILLATDTLKWFQTSN